MIMEIESEGLEYAYKKGKISELEYNLYQRYIKGLERRINRGFVSSLSYASAVFVLGLRRILHLAFTFKFRFEQEENRRGPRLTEENRDHMTELYLTNTEQVLEALSNLEGVYHSDLLSYLKRSRIREAEIIQSGAFVERVITHLNPDYVDEMLRGYFWNVRLSSNMNKLGVFLVVMPNSFVRKSILWRTILSKKQAIL